MFRHCFILVRFNEMFSAKLILLILSCVNTIQSLHSLTNTEIKLSTICIRNPFVDHGSTMKPLTEKNVEEWWKNELKLCERKCWLFYGTVGRLWFGKCMCDAPLWRCPVPPPPPPPPCPSECPPPPPLPEPPCTPIPCC